MRIQNTRSIGPGPLVWILGLAALATAGFTVGAFVGPLPSIPIGDPTTPPLLGADNKSHELTREIDRLMVDALSKSDIKPSAMATDAEYLRRAILDLTGKIPTYERVKAFLADTDPQKRPKLIDELLGSDEFGKHFATIWADMLIKRDADTNRGLRTEAFISWLAKQLHENQGWDKIVTEMITAAGSVEENPQTLFVLANQDNNQVSPAKLTAATANLFMGLQLQCAECHVHPTVDTWKSDDFWGMAAFFGHTKFERDGTKVPRAPVTAVKEVGRQAEPKGKAARFEKAIPSNDVISIPDPTDAKKTIGKAHARYFEAPSPAQLGTQIPYRPKLATWLTAPINPYFARATVNRFWGHLFAKGLIHPIEDMGPNSSCANPELLEALTRNFAANNFDVKHLLRAYCNTQAYNRTSKPTETNINDEALLSHMPVKVIGARELLDSIQVVTGKSPAAEPRRPREKNANKGMSAPATGVKFFDKREYEDDVTEFNYGIPQLLKQMNTNLTNGSPTVARFATKGRNRVDVITDLYVAALARPPRAEEVDRMERFIDARSDVTKAYHDIFWALLNSAEFISNH